jgi:hypothetical protein
MDSVERHKQDRSAMLAALAEAGADVRKPSAFRCPFHDDANASAGVYEKDGVFRFKCHGGTCGFEGDVFDVRAKAHGRKVDDVLRDFRKDNPDPKPATPKPKGAIYPSMAAWIKAKDHVVAVYEYHNPTTRGIDLLKMRREPPGERKTFVQAHVNDKGHVIESAPPSPWPIYRWPEVAKADSVFVVEGEKCADALAGVGIEATCGSAGAGHGKAKLTDWSPLKGKTVYLWPDNDPAGMEFMDEVANELQPFGCIVFRIDPAKLGLGEKEDAADYVVRFDGESMGDAKGAIYEAAKADVEKSCLDDHIEDAISGKHWTIPFPFKMLSNLTRAIQPGMITIWCGDPGSRKSFAALQMAYHWHNQGTAVAVYMLEDDKKLHMSRLLAQVSGVADVVFSEWQRANPETTRRLVDQYRLQLTPFERCMYDAPDEMLTYDDILKWIRKCCEGGAQILIVDPITQVDSGKEPWRADKEFIVAARGILRQYSAHLLLVSHPRDGKHTGTMDAVAGSRAFSRFPQSVLWLKRYPPESRATIKMAFGPRVEDIDATVKVAKARNGKNPEGVEIAFKFCPSSLTFKELGIVDGKVDVP